jgi:hypothetical protein
MVTLIEVASKAVGNGYVFAWTRSLPARSVPNTIKIEPWAIPEFGSPDVA